MYSIRLTHVISAIAAAIGTTTNCSTPNAKPNREQHQPIQECAWHAITVNRNRKLNEPRDKTRLAIAIVKTSRNE